ncbi:MAG: hypothetical protein V4683_09165 [Bacteroidota bacterium]
MPISSGYQQTEYYFPTCIKPCPLAGIVKRHQHMTFKDDINERIKTDFGENASKAATMLIDAIKKVDYLKTDRVIRCIIFLAKGNLTDLNKYIETATFDTRDVMLWAEYEGLKENEKPKRVRDFNKNFEECTNNVKE